MGECRAICVDPNEIGQVLPHISGLLDRALKHGGNINREEALAQLREGTFLLWLAASEKIEAIAVTKLCGDACEIVLCAGDDVSRWSHLIQAIEKFARDERRKCVRIFARKGWVRVLPDYAQTRVILEKEV